MGNNDQQMMDNDNTELINSLNGRLYEFDRYSNELKNELDASNQQKLALQSEYQVYVEKLQKQIENLVDQINNMTDEREAAFQRIDNSEKRANGNYFIFSLFVR
jgi:hypothetical protein